jgi:hypothetical protein
MEGQAMKKLIALAGALLVALACSEGQQAPTDVQFAKGGGSGVTFTNYWITTDNVIHVEGTGKVNWIAAEPAHDFWHNGTADDNYSDHFEIDHPGPGWVEVTRDKDTWTVDIPWNGERDPDSRFRNFASSANPDPFVFGFRYAVVGGRVWHGMRPLGVIVDGATLGMEYNGLRSYATYTGDAPDGRLYVNSLDLSEVSCTVTTTGHGKKASTKTVVSGRAQATLAATSDGKTPDGWMEFHLIVDGELGKRDTRYGAGADFVIETTLDDMPTQVTVGLLLDYVMPLHETIDYDFDPWAPTYAPDVFTVTCN